MAAMSVIGIDFGNESCYVAVAKAGGIETIANDYSLRGTPSCVAFSQKNRILGVAAKNQMVTNMKNTIFGFKRLLGRTFKDPHVQEELKHLPFKVEERPDGGVGIRVQYLNEDQVFTPEQVTAMLFTKLKETSANALQTQINDCVISVPSYFTNNERKALLDAAAIAGLNVLRLMNETTATSLAYGIYKQDLPAPEEKPRNVVFVDVGHSSLQVWACAFHRGKLRILASAADASFGGRDIDYQLAQYFNQEFQKKYRIDARGNPRAYLRLLQEVEKIKKQMSANSTKLPLNIECFIDEKDVTGEIQRSIMEDLCADLFQRVDHCLRSCLQQSKLRLEEVHSVEIVGGSSRIPAIKHLIENVFGKSPSTTLNQDEAVSRGAALQCAILSPAVRVRDFSVTDIQPYPVRLCWDADTKEDGEMEVFPANHAAPFSKLLTFYRREPFAISAYYSGQIPYPDPLIGKWVINDITPNAEGESQKLKIKVRVNIHGVMTVASATLQEKKEASGEAGSEAGEANSGSNGMETSQEQPAENSQQQNGAVDPSEDVPMDDNKKDKGKGKKQVVKTIELPIKMFGYGLSQADLNDYTEKEFSMQSSDKQEKERADARNALEEYIYEIRNNISEGAPMHEFVPATQQSSLTKKLDEMVDWLYEEGEDCNRQVYSDKLTEMRTFGEPIKSRYYQWECRPAALEEFAVGLQMARKVADQYKQGDAKYNHLTDEDFKKLTEKIDCDDKWLDKTRQTLNSTPLHENPPITVEAIKDQLKLFASTVSPIVNKPKPKEKTPPPHARAPGRRRAHAGGPVTAAVLAAAQHRSDGRGVE